MSVEEPIGGAATTVHRNKGVLAVDLAGNVTYVNRAAELMTGRSRYDLLGHPLGHLFETIESTLPEGLRTLIAYSAEPIHDRAGGIAGVIILFAA